MIKIMFCIIFQNVINQKKELKIELLFYIFETRQVLKTCRVY
jgi:hypothetical protein